MTRMAQRWALPGPYASSYLPGYDCGHLHAAPQRQTSPHEQPAALQLALGFWQPHWHADPAHDLQVHSLVLLSMFLVSFPVG
jgi:hypothetical protein